MRWMNQWLPQVTQQPQMYSFLLLQKQILIAKSRSFENLPSNCPCYQQTVPAVDNGSHFACLSTIISMSGAHYKGDEPYCASVTNKYFPLDLKEKEQQMNNRLAALKA